MFDSAFPRKRLWPTHGCPLEASIRWVYYPSPTAGKQGSSVIKNAGLTTMRTWVQIQATAGPCCEYELLTFILAPTAPISLRLRRSLKKDGQVPE